MLPSLWWGPRGLFPPLLPMFAGSRGMAGDRGGPSLCDIRGGILELPIGGLLKAGGGFLPCCGQFGPIRTRSSSGASPHLAMPYSHRRGVLSFLASRCRMPLELCTPATIDLVVMFFINSMEIGCTVWGASLALLKKRSLWNFLDVLESYGHLLEIVSRSF